MANANLAALRSLKNGSFVHVAGSGLAPELVRNLDAAGKLRKIRTGAATIYTLRSR